jgi:hypothetical protein
MNEKEPLALVESLDLALPPVPVPWGLVAAIVAGLLLAAAVVWWLLRCRRIRLATPIPPDVLALRDLEAVERESAALDANRFALRVSAVMRVYLDGRFGLRAPTLSTEDFLAEAAESPRLDDMDRSVLEAFLFQCDRVKFAQADLQEAERRALCQETRGFVQQSTARAAAEAAAVPTPV